MKLRINYVKENDTYSGYIVNLEACIAEAATLEELEYNLKILAENYLEILTKSIDEPFEMKEVLHYEY